MVPKIGLVADKTNKKGRVGEKEWGNSPQHQAFNPAALAV
jgi:hypothetical protein